MKEWNEKTNIKIKNNDEKNKLVYKKDQLACWRDVWFRLQFSMK